MINRTLINQEVKLIRTNERGRIVEVDDNFIKVQFYDRIVSFDYPSAFVSTLRLRDKSLQAGLENIGSEASFDEFRKRSVDALEKEIVYLKTNASQKYKAVDGECIRKVNEVYTYAFEIDTELHFPDGTAIKLWLGDRVVKAYVLSCEDFSIIFRVSEYLGKELEYIEFSAEQWLITEELQKRVEELDPNVDRLAYEVACKGRYQIEEYRGIIYGQSEAIRRSSMQPILFIWGPPGTGKTTTLAKVAMEYLEAGKRVLMLSYSNVSVDGALMRVASMSNHVMGTVVRYGYPRLQEVANNKALNSYQIVMQKNPVLSQEYYELIEKKKKLKAKDPERIEINKRINQIRDKFHGLEIELIQNAGFVATTVSKAIVDKAVYTQRFDIVIFDEASMAYVPQVVFAAGLAKEHFCCLGDFRQLPAIVQDNENIRLEKDIFEYTGITDAVENGYGHKWLVMLNIQYRMHPDIAAFASISMYDGLLKSGEGMLATREDIARCEVLKDYPIGLIDLSYMYSVCIKAGGGSHINLMSALVSMRLAQRFCDSYAVGIITPYREQAILLLAMLRDLREVDEKYNLINTATVHQFQGSEKEIIIYDAVDCFRVPYPGKLLTDQRNNQANRLFNVAMTRAMGKFVLVANEDYLRRKNISKKLMFTQALDYIRKEKAALETEDVLRELEGYDEKSALMIGKREDTWNKFLADIENAQRRIHIDIPGAIMANREGIHNQLIDQLDKATLRGVNVTMRVADTITLPKIFDKYAREHSYVTNPVTLIDKEIIWFGHPIAAPDFITEGEPLITKVFPTIRFIGKYTARSVQALLEIPK